MGAQHNTMRRIARLDRSIDLLRARATVQAPSTYLCSACKHHASPFSTSALRAASNGKVPLTEKLRRKIWGTDNPPGLEDPYGDRSVFDQSKKKERRLEKEERDAARLEAQSAAEIENYTGSSRYEPASTWDGLERVGWTEDRWDPENLYTPFVPMEVKTDSEEITAALHRAMVEVFALREAGVPLGSLSKDTPGQDMTLDVTFDQSPSGPVLKFMDAAPPLDDIVQSLTRNRLQTIHWRRGTLLRVRQTWMRTVRQKILCTKQTLWKSHTKSLLRPGDHLGCRFRLRTQKSSSLSLSA